MPDSTDPNSNVDELPALDPVNDPLWQRIEAHRFDDPDSDLSFTARLARENGWKADYAERVVEEYKRFVYLAMRAGHEVTPSDDVDQAWHLHLTYSRNYWDVFCKDVLGTPLHHGPTQGGRDEAEKYWDQYRQTRESYMALSGDRPPADIWPLPQDRFRDVSAMRRVNTAGAWVIRKPTLQQFRMIRWGVMVAAIVLIILGHPWMALCAGAFWLMTTGVMAREESLKTRRLREDDNLALMAGTVAMMDGVRGDGFDQGSGSDGGGGCGGCGGG